MIIGHLPAGYLVSRRLFPHFDAPGVTGKRFILAGAAGAIAPDLDMLYFHLMDQRMHHHHTYFTHYPLFWIGLLLLSACWLHGRRTPAAALALIFSLNGLFHMLLDSVVGDIWWLAPFVDRPFSLFAVPALYQPWWLNFVLHWSFALEIVIVLLAAFTWQRDRLALRGAAS